MSLMLNPLLICIIPKLATEFNNHCIENRIFEKIDTNYFIYVVPTDKPYNIKIFNLNTLINDTSIINDLFIDKSFIQNYKALQFMAYLIYTNKYDMIIRFFENYCENDDKHKIKMIFQGYFINEIF